MTDGFNIITPSSASNVHSAQNDQLLFQEVKQKTTITLGQAIGNLTNDPSIPLQDDFNDTVDSIVGEMKDVQKTISLLSSVIPLLLKTNETQKFEVIFAAIHQKKSSIFNESLASIISSSDSFLQSSCFKLICILLDRYVAKGRLKSSAQDKKSKFIIEIDTKPSSIPSIDYYHSKQIKDLIFSAGIMEKVESIANEQNPKLKNVWASDCLVSIIRSLIACTNTEDKDLDDDDDGDKELEEDGKEDCSNLDVIQEKIQGRISKLITWFGERRIFYSWVLIQSNKLQQSISNIDDKNNDIGRVVAWQENFLLPNLMEFPTFSDAPLSKSLIHEHLIKMNAAIDELSDKEEGKWKLDRPKLKTKSNQNGSNGEQNIPLLGLMNEFLAIFFVLSKAPSGLYEEMVILFGSQILDTVLRIIQLNRCDSPMIIEWIKKTIQITKEKKVSISTNPSSIWNIFGLEAISNQPSLPVSQDFYSPDYILLNCDILYRIFLSLPRKASDRTKLLNNLIQGWNQKIPPVIDLPPQPFGLTITHDEESRIIETISKHCHQMIHILMSEPKDYPSLSTDLKAYLTRYSNIPKLAPLIQMMNNLSK